MPQMAPIMLLLLFIIFSLTLLLFCSSNYFLFMTSPPQTLEKKINSNSLNWKW
uniref:ATP synthase complex subunit 8 n=1 Tax=Micropathus cavernicola TaxID=3073456 RepID=A0AAU7B9V1_9ORTH